MLPADATTYLWIPVIYHQLSHVSCIIQPNAEGLSAPIYGCQISHDGIRQIFVHRSVQAKVRPMCLYNSTFAKLHRPTGRFYSWCFITQIITKQYKIKEKVSETTDWWAQHRIQSKYCPESTEQTMFSCSSPVNTTQFVRREFSSLQNFRLKHKTKNQNTHW